MTMSHIKEASAIRQDFRRRTGQIGCEDGTAYLHTLFLPYCMISIFVRDCIGDTTGRQCVNTLIPKSVERNHGVTGRLYSTIGISIASSWRRVLTTITSSPNRAVKQSISLGTQAVRICMLCTCCEKESSPWQMAICSMRSGILDWRFVPRVSEQSRSVYG